jgi:hypothetical protein
MIDLMDTCNAPTLQAMVTAGTIRDHHDGRGAHTLDVTESPTSAAAKTVELRVCFAMTMYIFAGTTRDVPMRRGGEGGGGGEEEGSGEEEEGKEIELCVDTSQGRDPWCRAGILTDESYLQFLADITATAARATRSSGPPAADHSPSSAPAASSELADSPHGSSGHDVAAGEASDP